MGNCLGPQVIVVEHNTIIRMPGPGEMKGLTCGTRGNNQCRKSVKRQYGRPMITEIDHEG